jgi:hypothetical protein
MLRSIHQQQLDISMRRWTVKVCVHLGHTVRSVTLGKS